jgi:glycine betaine/proline transport system substrate-binding protein
MRHSDDGHRRLCHPDRHQRLRRRPAGQRHYREAAQSTISEETFQTLLVSRALEKLGYTVEKPSEVDYNVAYTSIAAGDTTFIATNWQPLHDDMYAAAGGDNKFYRKGVYVSGAAQGYLIDKKTAEQYHITSIDQLKDPQIAKLFDTNNDGKADLTGCTQAGAAKR